MNLRATMDKEPQTKAKGPKRILSGVQPSGKLHLGNYFGAVKQHIALQDEGECFYFIADYHSLTTIRDTTERLNEHAPKKLSPAQYQAEFIRDVALDYLALGLDPEKAAFYRQSEVPEVDGQKMSKSIGNTIDIFMEGNALKKRVMSGIVTDSKSVEEPKDPNTCNVFALYSLFASPAEKAALAERYRAGGMGYGEA